MIPTDDNSQADVQFTPKYNWLRETEKWNQPQRQMMREFSFKLAKKHGIVTGTELSGLWRVKANECIQKDNAYECLTQQFLLSLDVADNFTALHLAMFVSDNLNIFAHNKLWEHHAKYLDYHKIEKPDAQAQYDAVFEMSVEPSK